MNTVYAAISAVQKELAEKGIGKNQTNEFDRYKFRGIDDVYNALGPILAKHELVIFPQVTNRETIERTSQKGGAMFHVILDVTYHFAGPDGSSIQVPVIGEALDRGDKAINKAFSAAYKLACFQTFCIPVQGQDTESESHVIEEQPKKDNSVIGAVLVGEKFDENMRDAYVTTVRDLVGREDDVGLGQILDELKDDQLMKLALWQKLDSKTRSYIKKYESDRRAAA